MMHERNAFLLLGCLCLALVTVNAGADGQAKAQACAACHGADGNSANPVWPSLAGQNAAYIVDQLKAFKSGARENPMMSPMAANLSEEDMQEIGEYYAAQAVAVKPIAADQIAAGERLYRGGDAERGVPACMACHGPAGAGNLAAGYPALRGQHPEYTVATLKAYRDGGRPAGLNGMMGSIAGKLSETDMEALARYVSALH